MRQDIGALWEAYESAHRTLFPTGLYLPERRAQS